MKKNEKHLNRWAPVKCNVNGFYSCKQDLKLTKNSLTNPFWPHHIASDQSNYIFNRQNSSHWWNNRAETFIIHWPLNKKESWKVWPNIRLMIRFLRFQSWEARGERRSMKFEFFNDVTANSDFRPNRVLYYIINCVCKRNCNLRHDQNVGFWWKVYNELLNIRLFTESARYTMLIWKQFSFPVIGKLVYDE